MEREVQQQLEANNNMPPANKQAYLYKKNPTSANKAITRKLRNFPATQEAFVEQNSSMPDDVRNSQIEAETIATQDQQSPRTASLKGTNIGRLDSGVVVASDVQRRPLDNRRFHTSHRGGQVYYEDNIDSETEVFFDPEPYSENEQFKNKTQGGHRDNIFPSAKSSGEMGRDLGRNARKQSQEDHLRAIDAVMNSNHNEATKQKLIADIQSKFRNSQLKTGGTEKTGKPRNSKKFIDHVDEFETPGPGRRNRHYPENKSKTVNRSQRNAHKGRKNTNQPPEYEDHRRFLMPEMNEFLGDGDRQSQAKSYLTQDEAGDSRLANLGINSKIANKSRLKNESGMVEQGEDSSLNMTGVTPGRIRASRLGQNSNMQEFPTHNNNYVRSPGASQDFLKSGFPATDKKRSRTKQHMTAGGKRANQSIADSQDTINKNDYNQLLPAMKLQKKKKRSPSNSNSKSPPRDGGGISNRGKDSISRMSAAVIDGKKLKQTLDQGLNFVKASVKVPVKQTNFYDNTHDSHITEQQLKIWKIKQGEVILDTFNTTKKNVPINRHRIPNVGADFEHGRKISPVDKNQFWWDSDGRKHKINKSKVPVVITSNVSLHKVDFPNIGSQPPTQLSPRGPGNKSQPPGRMAKMPPSSLSNKQIDPLAPQLNKPRKRVPTHLNVQSDAGLQPLIDIDLNPPNRNSTTKMYEPPIDNDIRATPQKTHAPPEQMLSPPQKKLSPLQKKPSPPAPLQHKLAPLAPPQQKLAPLAPAQQKLAPIVPPQQKLAPLAPLQQKMYPPLSQPKFARPQQKPAPPQQNSAPPEQKPAPLQQKPAPPQKKSAPPQQKPAPLQQKPAPLQQKPAPPQQKPAPPQQQPSPLQLYPAPPQLQPALEPISPQQKPSSPAQPQQKPSTPAEQKPSTTAPLQQKPSTPAEPQQKPSTPALLQQKPSTPASHVQKPATPTSHEQKPATPTSHEQKPATPTSHEQKPATPSKKIKAPSPPPQKRPNTPSDDDKEVLPDYECPVCEKRVPGRQTAKHSRQCRTHTCRYCQTEQPITELDHHEENCRDMRKCPYCRIEFPKPEYLTHELHSCPEAVTCQYCELMLPKRDVLEHEQRCCRVELCRFCREQFKMTELIVHEETCTTKVTCQFCSIELAKQDYDFHLERCAEVAKCRFCSKMLLSKDIGTHEGSECLNVASCEFCNQKMLKEILDQHIIKSCPKAKPGVAGDQEVDPRPYLEKVRKNAEKLSKKNSSVVVEDDFVTPSDFKGGIRKREGSINQSQQNQKFGSMKSKGSLQGSNHSLKRDLSRSQERVFPSPSAASNIRLAKADSQVSKFQPSKTRSRKSGSRSRKSGSVDRLSNQKSNDGGLIASQAIKQQALQTAEDEKNQASYDGGLIVSQANKQQALQTADDEKNQASYDRGLIVSQAIKQQALLTSGDEDLQPLLENASIAFKSDGLEQKFKSLESGSKAKLDSQIDLIDDYQDQKKGNGAIMLNDVIMLNEQSSQGQDKRNSSSSMSREINSMKKTKLQTQSQVRFAHHASESKVVSVNQASSMHAMSMNKKSMKQVMTLEEHHSSVNVMTQNVRRVTSTKGVSHKSISKKSESGLLKAMQGNDSRESLGRRSSLKKGSMSKESKSPGTRKVMESLTHGKVQIHEETKLLINGSEVLTHKGIKGKIHKVGVGFGTGRHTSGHRLDLMKEMPLTMNQEPERADSMQTLPTVPIIPIQHKTAPELVDIAIQIQDDTISQGCDPIVNSMRSAAVSAHQASAREINLSARSITVAPDVVSIGMSARPLSSASVREQGDQVSEGRFEPNTVTKGCGTDNLLLQEYFHKEMVSCAVNTQPDLFETPPQRTTTSCMVQTEIRLDESNLPDEPLPATTSYEPLTRGQNLETGSNGSLCDEPVPVESIPVPEANYVDDWAESEIYKYTFELNYDRMVRRKFIRIEQVKRPELSKQLKGMNNDERLEHNLNPLGLPILTQIECEYGQATLRHKSANMDSEQVLNDLYTRAKQTIEVLERNMVRPEVSSKILFLHYTKVTSTNVIKLLIRVKKLYEARNEAINILKKVMEAEAFMQPKELVWRVLQNAQLDSGKLGESERNLVMRAIKILSDALTLITIFQQEHKLFRDEFRFNSKFFRAYMKDMGKIIGGYLKVHNEPNPALQETGLLLEEHAEHEIQKQRYEEWVRQSHAEHGVLEVPSAEEIEQTLQPEKPARKVKGSRIDRALEKMRQEQALKSESNSQMMDLTSKSKILEQMQLKVDRFQEDSNQAKPTISDQMLERIQASAAKKEASLLMHQENHYSNQVSQAYISVTNRTQEHIAIDYQRQVSQNSKMSIARSDYQESQLNNGSGDYQEKSYHAISDNRYAFNTPSMNTSNDGVANRAQFNIMPAPPATAFTSKFQSQPDLTPQLQYSAPTQNVFLSRHVDNYDENAHYSLQESETTMRRNLGTSGSAEHVGFAAPIVAISEMDGDNATEFTEQYDRDIDESMYALDLEHSVKRVEQSEFDGSVTEFGEETKQNRQESALRIINDGGIYVKYAESRPSTMQEDHSAQDGTNVSAFESQQDKEQLPGQARKLQSQKDYSEQP